MIRRKLTLKRVDPWSVLKFGFVVNIALLMVGMLAAWILWTVIGRLGLVDQFCDSVGSIVLDLQECSLNGGNIFRTLLLLGLLGVVVQTGIMVFGAFLYNLIADLTGGLGFTFFDEAGDATTTPARSTSTSSAQQAGVPRTGAPRGPVQHPGAIDSRRAPTTVGGGSPVASRTPLGTSIGPLPLWAGHRPGPAPVAGVLGLIGLAVGRSHAVERSRLTFSSPRLRVAAFAPGGCGRYIAGRSTDP